VALIQNLPFIRRLKNSLQKRQLLTENSFSLILVRYYRWTS